MAGESKLGSAYIPIRATLDELDKDLAGARGKVEGALAGVQDLGKLALGGLAAGALAAAAAIGTIGPAAIDAASDLNESMSKANVVFGTSIGVIDEFAKTSARSFGIAAQVAYESTGTFGNLFTTMGLGKGAAADMSVDIVKLAADLASFNNLPTDMVLEKLRSGLVGEAEPLRTMGINITAAAVEAKAMSMNLGGLTVSAEAVAKAESKVYEATKSMYVAELKFGTASPEWRAKQQALTEAQNQLNAARRGSAGPLTDAMKLQARFALIMDQSTTAQGDFARTSDGLANTQRILGATWKDLLAKVGTAFLPVVLAVAQAITPLADALMPRLESALATAAPIITTISEAFSNFIGNLTAGSDPLLSFRLLISQMFPPEISNVIRGIIDSIIEFVGKAQETLAPVMAWISQNVSLQDVLIALGIAIAAVVIPAIVSIVAAVAPIVAAFIGLVAVVAVLRQAWDTDWGGIRTTLIAFWEGTAKPALAELWTWLQVNVPAAIQTLSKFWTGTLQPALAQVWAFIQTSVLPMLGELWTWLATNVPAAIQTLSEFWTGTLQPALAQVWAFIQTSVLPMLGELWTWLQVNVPAAIQTLVNFWNNTLLPAIQEVWAFISTSLIPLFEALANVYIAAISKSVEYWVAIWNTQLAPALTAIWNFITTYLGPVLTWLNNVLLAEARLALEAISSAIGTVIGWLQNLADRINNLTLPSWLTPGSPTPFETGLLGVAGGAETATGALHGMALVAENELNRVLGGANGTISDLQLIQNIAKGSLGNIAEPLQATFFLIRDAAAEAGSAAGGVLNALMDIKSIGTIHTWIITHHRDVYEPSIDNTGGGGGGGGGGTCFVIHTPITMADRTLKEIQDITIGDRVLSWDTATGKAVEAEVCKVFHHDRTEVRGYAVINDVLCVTTEHPLFADGQWMEVAYLRRGNRLMDADGDPVVIESIGYVEEQAEVFNLHTSHPTHNYFAGGVLAHNAAKKAAGGPVRAGGVYLVGEQRPEIFVPDTSGMIVPNARRFLAQLNAAMGSVIQATAASAGAAVPSGRGDERGSGAAGGQHVTIYGLTIEGVQDARGLLGELQAMT